MIGYRSRWGMILLDDRSTSSLEGGSATWENDVDVGHLSGC